MAIFGLLQSIEIDSLRYSIDEAVRVGILTYDHSLWLLLAILQVASHLAASPGHFAEYLKIRNGSTMKRIGKLRRRSAWTQFLKEVERLHPLGSAKWRTGNRVFCSDATTLLAKLHSLRRPPRIVYADPPYSRAQYSRYYHVLET